MPTADSRHHRWVAFLGLLVLTAITRPDVGSFHRYLSRSAEARNGVLAGLFTRAATLVGFPFGLVQFKDWLLFTTASVRGTTYVGVWGTWWPWGDGTWRWDSVQWGLALPRCARCVNGLCVGTNICVCVPSHTGPHCARPIPGFQPLFPSLTTSLGILDLLLLAMVLLHALHLLVPSTHAFHRFAFRHFEVSWQAVARGRLHTLLTAPLFHKHTVHLASNAVSFLAYAPLVAGVVEAMAAGWGASPTTKMPSLAGWDLGAAVRDPAGTAKALTSPAFWREVPGSVAAAARWAAAVLGSLAAQPSARLLGFLVLAGVMSSLGTLLVAALLSRSRATGYGFSGVVSAMRTLVAVYAGGPVGGWMGSVAPLGVEMIRDHIVWHFVFDLMLFGGSMDIGAHLGGSAAALIYHYAFSGGG
ncbi:hypothetical protein HDU96_009533 [Phlyctochytrium bullatum]|nr:hypothetical protein HDU96_009533 [Phlyctochytrium bullatum]